jgi:hypothetical protein
MRRPRIPASLAHRPFGVPSRVAAVCGLLLAAVVVGALLLAPVQAAVAGIPLPQLLSRLTGGIVLREPGYTLAVDPISGVVDVETPGRHTYTTLPLAALVGFDSMPQGMHRRFRRTAAGLVEELSSPGGTVLQRVLLTPRSWTFTVTFSSRVGPDRTLMPRFFFDGARGIDLQSVQTGFTPNAPTGLVSLPGVFSVPRSPLSPPPLDLQLRTSEGWLGVGLVQVPDATSMRVLPSGAVAVDYPLGLLASFPDSGGGGLVGSMARFPAFLFTFGSDPLDGLRQYGRALVALGQAPASWSPRPAWWRDPIVDTWGAQVAEHAARGSALFTSAWVHDFAAASQRRLGSTQLTLVIDSRWQQSIGEPAPDPVRFGGWTGMRELIDQLHAEGLRVVLWWPMWIHGMPTVPPSMKQVRLAARTQLIDPTAPGFDAATAVTVERLLGSAPGDLDADGLKLDWTYDIPATVQDPALGWGDAALYRYLGAIDAAAHAVQGDALVEASAAAPQFARVTDAVRLYDAWTEADWDARAAVVSAADPTALIDGDGWAASPTNALRHAVTSTVYGVPAFYFGDVWANGGPISAEVAREIGQVMALAPLKGDGSARRLGDGEWAWMVRGKVQAQTFDGQRDLILWSSGCDGGARATVVATTTGRALVPTPAGERAHVVDAAGGTVPASPIQGGTSVHLVAGNRYSVVQLAGCPGGPQITPLARRSSGSSPSSR